MPLTLTVPPLPLPRGRRSSPFLLVWFLTLLVGAGPLSGVAAARATVGVLAPLEGLGVPAAEAGRVQRWVEAALASVDGFRWLAPGRLGKLLRGSAQLVGCESQPACLGGLARQVGADVVVAGEVGSLGGGFMVYLRLVGSQGRSLRNVSGVLDPSQGGLRDTARGLALRLLDPERYTGTLEVLVDMPHAWIYVDGKRVASSPAPPIPGLAVGPHALRVTHEAYRDFVRFVNVDFGRSAKVTVSLTAYPVRAEQMRLVDGPSRTLGASELPWYRRWWALTALGVVVVAGSATTAALLFKRSAPHDAEVVIRP